MKNNNNALNCNAASCSLIAKHLSPSVFDNIKDIINLAQTKHIRNVSEINVGCSAKSHSNIVFRMRI